jgi:hypothetical protein
VLQSKKSNQDFSRPQRSQPPRRVLKLSKILYYRERGEMALMEVVTSSSRRAKRLHECAPQDSLQLQQLRVHQRILTLHVHAHLEATTRQRIIKAIHVCLLSMEKQLGVPPALLKGLLPEDLRDKHREANLLLLLLRRRRLELRRRPPSFSKIY